MGRPVTARYRWPRAVAALAGIALVLVSSVVVANRLSTRRPLYVADESNVLTVETNPLDIPDYVLFVGPVSLGNALTVWGDTGFWARLQAVRANGVASYTVRIQNTGSEPIDGSFTTGGAWLDTEDGTRFYPPEVRTLPTSTAPPNRIVAGTESDLILTFKVPAQARPTRLVLPLRLGEYLPNAQWTLTP
jgi:hypothetical protein